MQVFWNEGDEEEFCGRGIDKGESASVFEVTLLRKEE
jgi:hypothetical protein